MGIALGSNFDFQAALPLDSRTVVADITARDAIASGVRYEGLIVYVEDVSEQTNYQLVGGITNGDWVELAGGGGSTTIPPSVAVSALDIDWSLGNFFYKSVAANSTITFSNTQDGKAVTFLIENTSGATITLTFPTLVKDATYELTVDAGKKNTYTFAKINTDVVATYISRMS
jgi:CBS domain-containing protein